MQVQWMDIKRLVPCERNAKQHPEEQISKIATSIDYFGWDQPIVVDEYMVIIKGHGRYFAAERLGWDKVPALVRDDLTDEAKRAARLADNRTAESSWDWDLVKVELEELQGLDFDIEVTGFDEGEINDLQIDREGNEKSGQSPWERMGEKAEQGILVNIGDITCRISQEAYDVLSNNCPEYNISKWFEGVIYAACSNS